MSTSEDMGKKGGEGVLPPVNPLCNLCLSSVFKIASWETEKSNLAREHSFTWRREGGGVNSSKKGIALEL